MKAENIDYIAMEGGGGKGIVYLGAIRALEMKKKLPLDKSSKENNLNCLKGIGGSSAGAITTYMLALGMNGDEIEKESRKISIYEKRYQEIEQKKREDSNFNPIEELNKKDKKNRFSDFYDEPNLGIFRAVVYDKENGKNVPGYGVNVANMKKNFFSKTTGRWSIKGVLVAKTFLQQFPVDKYGNYNKFIDFNYLQAIDYASKYNSARESSHPFWNKFFKLIGGLLGSSLGKKILGIDTKNQFLAKITSKGKALEYFKSVISDRGFCAGIEIRSYFQKLTVEMMMDKFQVEMSYEKASTMTFRDLLKNTDNDLRIAGCNTKKGLPVYFSAELTPDFPVIEAVCMAMSIPFAYKPIFVDAIVDKSKKSSDPHNQKYKGYYNDAGTLNNLPIHAFDDLEGSISPKLNEKMLGIRCQGGFPLNPEEDDFVKYMKDDENYNIFFKPYKESDKRTDNFKEYAERADPPETYDFVIDDGHYFSPIIEFLGSIYGAFMYNSEDGQIRSLNEKKHTVELYSYDVGLFDFQISDELANFVQARAMMKIGALIGVDKEEMKNSLLKFFYKSLQKINQISDDGINDILNYTAPNTYTFEKYLDHIYKLIEEYKRENGIK